MEKITEFIATYILIPQANAASEQLLALIGRVNEHVINPLIVLLFTAGLVLFIVGLFNFFSNRDDSEALDKGKRHMLWGIIGMAIMISVFGIMKFLTGSLGITDATGNSAKGGSGDVSGLISNN